MLISNGKEHLNYLVCKGKLVRNSGNGVDCLYSCGSLSTQINEDIRCGRQGPTHAEGGFGDLTEVSEESTCRVDGHTANVGCVMFVAHACSDFHYILHKLNLLRHVAGGERGTSAKNTAGGA